MAVRAPESTQHLQSAFRQWHVTVSGSLSVPHVDHHAVAIDILDLQVNAFL
jgi:hypothetical protein